jgi:AraC-like DNA-binding protein
MSAADEKFLKEVTDTIDAHLSDSDLNVQSLCDYIGMGNKLVYRRLKQLTGKTPVEYIRSIRLNKAAVLLKQKKFTISEVMYLSGFSNASYFSKCFLAEYGCSPRDYIEKV